MKITKSFCIILLAMISFVIILGQQGEINRDGVLYLTQSQYFVEGNWDQALQVYHWPAFSFLIAGIHYVTGISLLYSAHFLNIFLFLLASYFFLKNIELISNNSIPPIFGTLILLTAIPLMDDYLGMVLRDHGQWAGFMMGIYFFFRWQEKSTYIFGLLWQIGFVFGALFRPECLIFNVLLPMINQFFKSKIGRLETFLQSISLSLIGLLILFLCARYSIFNIEFNKLDSLSEFFNRPLIFIENLTLPLSLQTDNYFLQILINDFSISFKYIFLTYIFIYKWFSGVGLLHLVFFIATLRKRLIANNFLRYIFIFFVLCLSISAINLFSTLVLTKRYFVINWWLVYLVSTFGFYFIWKQLSKSNYQHKLFLKITLIIFMLIYFLNVLIDKPELHFEHAAGNWIQDQHFDLNNIYFNNDRLAFYSGLLAFKNEDMNTALKVIRYKYLMLHYNRFEEIEPIENYVPFKYFPSQEKPKLIFYERINND
jgi:hypothetical protein